MGQFDSIKKWVNLIV